MNCEWGGQKKINNFIVFSVADLIPGLDFLDKQS